MIFVSTESYEKGLLVNRWFKNTSYNPGREILVQNWKNRDSFVGVKIWYVWNFVFQHFCILIMSIV